jgi:serine/threonine protein kinase
MWVQVVHADLAARNILLFNNGVVKITDFGLSRQLYTYATYVKKQQVRFRVKRPKFMRRLQKFCLSTSRDMIRQKS